MGSYLKSDFRENGLRKRVGEEFCNTETPEPTGLEPPHTAPGPEIEPLILCTPILYTGAVFERI